LLLSVVCEEAGSTTGAETGSFADPGDERGSQAAVAFPPPADQTLPVVR